MKRIILVLILTVLLSGCASYKFQRGEKPYENGYVVSRSGYTILEYTVGKDNSVPQDLYTAKRRFQRRRSMVEHYYKKMGEIENRFKGMVIDPPLMGLKFIGGILRLPCVAVSDYRYEHNPAYREKLKKMEQKQDESEAARIARFRGYLNNYIQRDLAFEQAVAALLRPVASPVKQETSLPTVVSARASMQQPPVSEAPAVEKSRAENAGPLAPRQKTPTVVTPLPLESVTQPLSSAVEKNEAVTAGAKREQKILEAMRQAAPLAKKKKERPLVISQPKAVIIAEPQKGYSPLKAHFYGSKSRSVGAKITSYLWDFGDGDTSNKPNPVNTYYSGSFDPKHFAVTLTVTDSQGNSDTAQIIIEVLNK